MTTLPATLLLALSNTHHVFMCRGWVVLVVVVVVVVATPAVVATVVWIGGCSVVTVTAAAARVAGPRALVGLRAVRPIAPERKIVYIP